MVVGSECRGGGGKREAYCNRAGRRSRRRDGGSCHALPWPKLPAWKRREEAALSLSAGTVGLFQTCSAGAVIYRISTSLFDIIVINYVISIEYDQAC